MKIDMVDDDFNEVKIEEVHVPTSCKSPIPRIEITPRCRWEMHVLPRIVVEEIGNYETIAYIAGTVMGKGEKLFIPVHEVSGASVTVQPDHVRNVIPEIEEENKKREAENVEIRKYNDELPARNAEIEKENAKRAKKGEEPFPFLEPKVELKPLKIVGWTHSHVDFGVFSSGTDNVQHEKLHDELILTDLKDDADYKDCDDKTLPKPFYIMGITVNVRKQEYGVIYASYPCGFKQRYEDVPIYEMEDTIPLEVEEKEKIIDEIYEQVKSKVRRTITRRSYPKYDYGKQWRGYDTSYQETTRKTGNKGVIKTSLDNFYKKKGSPEISVMVEIEDETKWKNLIKDPFIVNEARKIKKLLGKNTEEFEVVKIALIEIMERERELILKKTREIIVDNINEQETKEEEKVTSNDYYIYDVEEEKKEDDDDEQEELKPEDYFDENDNPIKCKCGEDLNEDNFMDFIGSDGIPRCINCSEDDIEEENESDEFEEYFDEEKNPIKCFSCKEELFEEKNYFGDENEDGMPLCSACAPSSKDSDNGKHTDDDENTEEIDDSDSIEKESNTGTENNDTKPDERKIEKNGESSDTTAKNDNEHDGNTLYI